MNINKISAKLNELETDIKSKNYFDLLKIIDLLRNKFVLKYIFLDDSISFDFNLETIIALSEANEIYPSSIINLISEIAEELLFEDMECYKLLHFIENSIEKQDNKISILARQI